MNNFFDKFLVFVISLLLSVVLMFLFGELAPASMVVLLVPLIGTPAFYLIIEKIFSK